MEVAFRLLWRPSCCPFLAVYLWKASYFLCNFFFKSIKLYQQWDTSLYQVAKVLELQLQHQSFQWIFRVDPLGLTGLISLLSKGLSRADSLEKTLVLQRLRAGGEGDDRGWDGWMASSTQWTWVWANSGRQWRTGKPGVLQFIGL